MDTSTWIALGALLVSVLGFVTNWVAIRREQADRKEAIEAGWAGEWAAQRPVVYPLVLRDWAYGSEGSPYRLGNARVLPLKNGGRGPALNVSGLLSATSSDGTAYKRTLLAGTIAAGDLFDARVIGGVIDNWMTVSGWIRYFDLTGAQWETKFEFSEEAGGEIGLEVHEPTQTLKRDLSL